MEEPLRPISTIMGAGGLIMRIFVMIKKTFLLSTSVDNL